MPAYDPSQHRHSMRLPGHDYTQPGAYFVTICTYARVCSLGEVGDGQMQLNDWGRVVADCWAAIPAHFDNVTLDEWVVMPNHLHGIVVITDSTSPLAVGAQQCCAPTAAKPRSDSHPNVALGSLGAIIRSFKSVVTKRIHLLCGSTASPMWQRNYHEHVVRDQRALNAVRQYIRHNPAKWQIDRDNMANGQPEATSADDYVREANT